MNTPSTFSHDVSGEKDFGFAQAIKVGDTIYISGQLSHDETGEFVHAHDLAAQFERVWSNLDTVLAHFGATRNQIVQDGVFVVDLPDHAATVAAAHLAYFGDHRPTSTTVGVAALFFPGQLLEINFIVNLTLPA